MSSVNLTEIQNYIENHLQITGITILDESHLHQTHSQYQATKAYLKIYMPRPHHLSRIALHRLVMQYAQEACNQPIHAIAIHTTHITYST